MMKKIIFYLFAQLAVAVGVQKGYPTTWPITHIRLLHGLRLHPRLLPWVTVTRTLILSLTPAQRSDAKIRRTVLNKTICLSYQIPKEQKARGAERKWVALECGLEAWGMVVKGKKKVTMKTQRVTRIARPTETNEPSHPPLEVPQGRWKDRPHAVGDRSPHHHHNSIYIFEVASQQTGATSKRRTVARLTSF